MSLRPLVLDTATGRQQATDWPFTGLEYSRWTGTGDDTTTDFAVAGCTSDEEMAYRVTVGGVLQDPASYTISLVDEEIVFSEAPPDDTEIVVIEQQAATLDPGGGDGLGFSAILAVSLLNI